MLTESNIVPECVYGPGSIGGLIALYEANFIKLDRLIGAVRKSAGDSYLSSRTADCDLYLTVESSVKYTQVVRLTYLFPDEETPDVAELVADPDLCVRIFLDARLVEVTGWAAHHQHEVLKNLQDRYTRELDRRWANNMMLSKWLDYLLDMRHTFEPLPETVAVPGVRGRSALVAG